MPSISKKKNKILLVKEDLDSISQYLKIKGNQKILE